MAFRKQETDETVQDDTFINDIINSIEQKPFAVSNENVCYASASELAGYYFLQTIIVGKFKIKTFNGAQLTLVGLDFKLKLASDMMELESELSNVSKSYITRIDFVLNENDLPIINRSQINTMILSAKKQNLKFSVIQLEEEIITVNEETSTN